MYVNVFSTFVNLLVVASYHIFNALKLVLFLLNFNPSSVSNISEIQQITSDLRPTNLVSDNRRLTFDPIIFDPGKGRGLGWKIEFQWRTFLLPFSDGVRAATKLAQF